MRALPHGAFVPRHQGLWAQGHAVTGAGRRGRQRNAPMMNGSARRSRYSLVRRFIGALGWLALLALLSGTASAQVRGSGPPDQQAITQHLLTGFALTGAHEHTRCESCHVRGEFKNTPKTCAGCHTPTARIAVVTINTSHPPTVEPCSVCHSTVTFAGARFMHVGITPGTCATCHNGSIATGKPAGHIPTNASCDTCHRITGWRGATVDHASVQLGSCASCHNGASAKGKAASHIPT